MNTETIINIVVAVVVTIVTVVTTFLITRYFQQKKGLDCILEEEVPVLTVSEEVGSDIKITYKNRQVKNLSILLVTLEGTGNTPITEEDIKEPIIFNFSNQVGLLSAEITDPQNSVFSLKPDLSNKKVGFVTKGINPGQKIKIKFLLTEYDNSFNVTGYILGVKEINIFSSSPDGFYQAMRIALKSLPIALKSLILGTVLLFWTYILHSISDAPGTLLFRDITAIFMEIFFTPLMIVLGIILGITFLYLETRTKP